MKRLLLSLLVVTVTANAAPLPNAPVHPSFQLDAQAKRTLVEKANGIGPEDSYRSVIGKLGTPTYDEKVARKENARIIGRILKYYAVIWEDGLVNEKKDELVWVFLDEHDRVRSVGVNVRLEH